MRGMVAKFVKFTVYLNFFIFIFFCVYFAETPSFGKQPYLKII